MFMDERFGVAAIAATALLVSGIVGVTSASAQDTSAEWKRIVAAAEKEGTVVLNVQPNKRMRSYVQKAWPKAYPKIKLSMSVVPGRQFIARIKTERKAGKFLWDAGFSGAPGGYRLSKVGIVDPFLPVLVDPVTKDPKTWGGWDNAFFDKQKKYVFSIAGFLKSPFYNAKKVSPEKVAKLGLQTLLDPAYKGKIIWHDPAIRGSGRSFGYLLKSRLGDDGPRKLIVDQKVRFASKQHQITEALARGTAWIGIGPIVTSLLEPYVKAGLELDIRPFGNQPIVNEMSTGGSTLYVYNKRPHPNATKVFINWLLSKETQLGLGKAMKMDSRRQDVAAVAGPARTPIKGAKYLESQREDYAKEVRAAQKFIRGIRKSMKK